MEKKKVRRVESGDRKQFENEEAKHERKTRERDERRTVEEEKMVLMRRGEENGEESDK